MSDRDSLNFPSGYRRYVYRVRIGALFKERFRVDISLPPDSSLRERLGEALNNVEIDIARSGGESGHIEIYFYSDREFRDICRRIGISFASRVRTVSPPPTDDQLRKQLSKALGGLEVDIVRTGGERGRIVIYFYSDKELRSIRDRIIK